MFLFISYLSLQWDVSSRKASFIWFTRLATLGAREALLHEKHKQT